MHENTKFDDGISNSNMKKKEPFWIYTIKETHHALDKYDSWYDYKLLLLDEEENEHGRNTSEDYSFNKKLHWPDEASFLQLGGYQTVLSFQAYSWYSLHNFSNCKFTHELP